MVADNPTNACIRCGAPRKPNAELYCSRACFFAARYEPAFIERRFWAAVEKTDNCWIWHGNLRTNGYGAFFQRGVFVRAHRMSWELLRGPIPDGLEVCHNCPTGDNPRCVRPDHLWLGTHADNMRDMAVKGRAYRLGVVHGEQQGLSKLTENDVRIIRAERATGALLSTLAQRFNVHFSVIGKIARRRAWKHVA